MCVVNTPAEGYCDCNRRCSKCGKLKTTPWPHQYQSWPYVYPSIWYSQAGAGQTSMAAGGLPTANTYNVTAVN